eukprot:1850862-Prymnesium_polylepis.1
MFLEGGGTEAQAAYPIRMSSCVESRLIEAMLGGFLVPSVHSSKACRFDTPVACEGRQWPQPHR